MQKNPVLAAKLRQMGMQKIVDSDRVRNFLGLKIHSKATNSGPGWLQIDRYFERIQKLSFNEYIHLIELLVDHARESEISAVVSRYKNKYGDDDSYALLYILDKYFNADLDEYQRAHNKFLQSTNNDKYKVNGLGFFFQTKGNWDYAANAYHVEFQRLVDINHANLSDMLRVANRAAYAYERTYDYTPAIEFYKFVNTIELSDSTTLRIGICNYKLQNYEQALSSLGKLNINTPQNIVAKLFTVKALSKLSKFKEAFEAFHGFTDLQSINTEINKYVTKIPQATLRNSTDSARTTQSYLYWLGRISQTNSVEENSTYITNAIYRAPFHTPSLFVLKSLISAAEANWQEAIAEILSSELHQGADGLDLKRYSVDDEISRSVKYASFRKFFNINSNVVLFESYHGNEISCHPLAIFKEMLDDVRFKSFQFVWVLSDTEKLVYKETISDDRVILVARGSEQYLYHLGTAKYLINNVTFPTYFTIRNGQKYLNTWHGIPIKALGKDIDPGSLVHSNVARNILNATHIISYSNWYADNFLRINGIENLFNGKNSLVGAPRLDTGFRERSSTNNSRKRKVLYAPTWRGTNQTPSQDHTVIEQALTALSQLNDVEIFFKPHQFLDKNTFSNKMNQYLIENTDISELLNYCDVLITDYSSIVFDFLPFNSNIIFFVPDFEEYKSSRGLYFNFEDLPGLTAINEEQLIHSVNQIHKTEQEYHHEISEDSIFATNNLNDGMSSRRTIDFFFFDDETNVIPNSNSGKTSIVFHNGMYQNGITTSLQNLIKTLVDDQSQIITVVTDCSDLKNNESRQLQIQNMPETVDILGKVGQICVPAEQRWIYNTFLNTGRIFNENFEAKLKETFSDEHTRVFGFGKIDQFIEFEGIAPFWSFLVTNSGVSDTAIWQHSDIHAEMSTRFPQLKNVFQQYKYFNKIVSISPSITKLNFEKLSLKYHVTPSQVKTIKNPASIVSDINGFSKPHDLKSSLNQKLLNSTFTFLAVGRLSVEKNLSFMLKSFAQLQKTHRAQLFIVGAGPLLDKHVAEVKKLGIADKVFFTGALEDPSYLYRHSDAFLMSSSHEGMPMVLLEALQYDLPILSTDLPGIRDTLEPLNAVVTPQDIDQYVSQMRLIIDGKSIQNKFDAVQHNRKVTKDFQMLFNENNVGD